MRGIVRLEMFLFCFCSNFIILQDIQMTETETLLTQITDSCAILA